MNNIYHEGHCYDAEDLQRLVADRDQWQQEAERLREADKLNGAAIRILTEQQKAALAEFRAALEFVDEQVRQAAEFETDPSTGQKITDAPRSTLYGVLKEIAPLLETLRQQPVQLDSGETSIPWMPEPEDEPYVYPQACDFTRADGKRCILKLHPDTRNAHKFECLKETVSGGCWLDEGHSGPCEPPAF